MRMGWDGMGGGDDVDSFLCSMLLDDDVGVVVDDNIMLNLYIECNKNHIYTNGNDI